MSSSLNGEQPSLTSSSQSSDSHSALVPVSDTPIPAQAATNETSGGNVSSSLDEQIERLKRCEYLKENEVKSLCLRAREILVDEGNVQRVDAPVTVSLFEVYLFAIVVDESLAESVIRERERCDEIIYHIG